MLLKEINIKAVYRMLPLQTYFILMATFNVGSGIGSLAEKYFFCHDVLSLGLPGTALQINLVL
jgi:hypothetical protein